MKRIRTIILLMAMMVAWTLNAQVDTIVTASGELGNPGSDLEFLNESGGLTRFPRLSDAGGLLYYPPLVTTDSVTNITSTSAIVYGNILFNGWYENVLEQGFQLSTTADFSGSITTQAITSNNPYSDCELPCVENIYSFIFTGLTSNTTYYVRAYATNSAGTAYGNEVSFTTTTPTPQDGMPCPNTPTLTDIDGNTYNTVQIGQQCWMKENLRVTKYADGTSISQGSTTSTTTAYWYYPNNSSSNMSTYGLLYNWKAVMWVWSSSNANPSGVQGICPTGWHVPSYAEWDQLTNYVSGQSPYLCGNDNTNIAKALAGTTGWNTSTNTCAIGDTPSSNNTTGFSALPAGYYDGSDNDFSNGAYFWSTTGLTSTRAYFRSLGYNDAGMYSSYKSRGGGCSVRCIRDEAVSVPTVTTSAVTNITATTATSGGNVISDGGTPVTARGVCWSTSSSPTISDSHTTDGSGTGSFTSSITGLTASSSPYYVRAYATNSVGTSYGNEEIVYIYNENDGQPCSGAATLTDIDGNIYNTVQIGSQCWMKENLRAKKYANGTSISQGSSTSTTTAYWCYPNNSSSNMSTYGLLYNWKAVMRSSSSSSANPSGVQGICPAGWHVPSYEEWTQLINYVKSQSQYTCGSNSNHIAKALASTSGWNSSTTTCAVGNTPSNNNATSFSALPAGGYDESYTLFGDSAGFWNSTESGSTYVYYGYLNYSYAITSRLQTIKTNFLSVRCVRD